MRERNPFVGPRPIDQGDAFYGRTKEVQELYKQLSTQRIVLLHSPSGAGKTSLVRAGLVPRLEADGFDVWPPIRLNYDPCDEDVPPETNRYLLSMMISLESERPLDDQRSPAELATLSLTDYQESRSPEGEERRPIVLVFDQFEEILTTAPRDVDAKMAFIDVLAAALSRGTLWALFLIREDYLGALTPYRSRLPTELANTVRLDLLTLRAAKEAATQAAQDGGRAFPGAERLIRDLATVSVQQPDGSERVEQGRYVEPVHLQVVCRRLWDAVPDHDSAITERMVREYAEVSSALSAYYAEAAQAAADAGEPEDYLAAEREVREWVAEQLIPGGIRRPVRRGAESSAGLANERIEALVDAYLVRTEQRAGATWYELSHDRMIASIVEDNADWEAAHLHPMQIRAKLWEQQKREPALLLTGTDADDAEAWASHARTLTPSEEDFLEASRGERQRQLREQRTQRWSALALIAVVLISLSAAGISGHMAREARNAQAEAAAAEQRARAQALFAAALGVQSAPLRAAVLREQTEAGTAPRNWLREALGVLDAPAFELTHIDADEVILALDACQQTGADRSRCPDDGVARIVTQSGNGAQVWDGRTGEQLASLEGHQNAVRGAAFSPDGDYLVTASADGTARVWSLDGASPVSVLDHRDGDRQAVLTASFSPDSRQIVTGAGASARVWALDSGQELARLEGHTDLVMGAAFSPDGARVLTSSQDGSVQIWDAASGANLLTLARGGPKLIGAAWSPDGQRVATTGSDSGVRLWDAASGTLKGLLYASGAQSYRGVVAFSRGGSHVLALDASNTVQLWRLADNGAGSDRDAVQMPHQDQVWGAAVSADGQRVYTRGADMRVRIWSTAPRSSLSVDAPAERSPGWVPDASHADWIDALWQQTGVCLSEAERVELLGEEPSEAVQGTRACRALAAAYAASGSYPPSVQTFAEPGAR